MRKIFILMIALLIFPSVLGMSLNVEKTSTDEYLVLGIDEPAIFELNVTNNGASDRFLFYTFFGSGLEPSERIEIKRGESKEIELKVYPREKQTTGLNTVSIYIQSTDSSEQEEKYLLNVIELEEVFRIGSGEIDPTSSSMEIYVKNQANKEFKDITADFNSPFFKEQKTFDLAPHEEKVFNIDVKKEDFSKLTAGFYTLNADFEVMDRQIEVEGKIEFVEKDIVLTERKDSGLIINKKIIEKENQGNLIVDTETIIKKNIISRLFTSFSPEPEVINREGFIVYYTWNRELAPGDKLSIIVKTNWLIPFLIILLIVAIVVLTKKYSGSYLTLRKRVSFVKTKGGEFALKVTVIAEANQFVENVKMIDTLPPLVQVYHRFGGQEPSNISKRRLEWELGNLEPGERRIISYIVYSKVGVLGRFALSPTIARYEKDGRQKQSSSNRAFFVTQPSKKDENVYEDY